MALAAFDIRKGRDAAGNEITPAVGYTSALIWSVFVSFHWFERDPQASSNSHPKNFCEIKPRSQTMESLIRSIEEEHPGKRMTGMPL